MNTKELVTWINELIIEDKIYKFYKSKYFRRLRKEVLREQHFECQRCKEKGKLTIVKDSKKKSGVVHHNKEVREHPELALSKHYIDEQGNKQKQLIVLCNECHEIVHNRFAISEPLNIERW